MVIVAMIAAGVSLAINPTGSSAKQINQQGDRLFAQMQYALDEALISNKALGIDIEQGEDQLGFSTTYSWLQFDGVDPKTNVRRWPKTQSPLGQHQLSENLAWQIEIEEASLEDSLDELLAEDEEDIQPEIVFSPSGEVTPFSMVISLSEQALQEDPEALNERYKIVLNERGELARFQVGEVEP